MTLDEFKQLDNDKIIVIMIEYADVNFEKGMRSQNVGIQDWDVDDMCTIDFIEFLKTKTV